MSDVTLTIDANTARYIAQMNRMAQSTQQQGKKVRKSLDFGSVIRQGLPMLGQFATRLGPIGAASTLIFTTWTKTVQTIEQAARKIESTTDARGRFLTLFDDPNKARAAAGQVDKLRAAGLSDQDAFGAGFAAQSRGLFNHLDAFGQVRQTGQITDTGSFIDSTADLQQAFGADNSEIPAILEKLFQGAKTSKADLQVFTQTMAEMGVLARTTGTSFDELAGFLASLGGEGIERLRTKVNALQTASIGSTEGLTAVVTELSQLDDKRLKARVGSADAVIAVRLLQEVLGSAQTNRGVIASAPGQGGIARSLEVARTADAGFAYSRDLQSQKQQAALAQEGEGRLGLLQDRITALQDEIIQLKGGEFRSALSAPISYASVRSGFRRHVARAGADEGDLREVINQLILMRDELKVRNRQTGGHEERTD